MSNKKETMTVKKLYRILVDPFYCIDFDKSHFGTHEPMVSKKDWIKLQMQTINGYTTTSGEVQEPMGLEKWLELLLDVLEKGQGNI